MDCNETGFVHTAGEDYFSIDAGERWSVAMLNKFKKQCPDMIKYWHENDDGSIHARIDYKCFPKVHKPYTKNFTEEQRKAFSDRMKDMKLKNKETVVKDNK